MKKDLSQYLNSDDNATNFIEKLYEEYEPLTFDEAEMEERFNKLFSYGGADPASRIPIYDVEHAEEQFYDRFPDIPWSEYKKILAQGMKKIKQDWQNDPYNYAIVSRSTDIKIPLELRPDRYTKELIAAISTTLDNKRQPRNTRGERVVIVEGKEETFDDLKEKSLTQFIQVRDEADDGKGMPYYHMFEDGKHTKTFRVIEVD